MATSRDTYAGYIGSMGLHQNNTNGQRETFDFLKNRSVIDVFRDFRDKYFGKPGVDTEKSHCNLTRQYSTSSVESEDVKFASLSGLPVYCKLMILSILPTQDVCSLSCANRHWKEICNDNLLWREILLRDMCTWNDITDKSHPLLPNVWNNENFPNIQSTNLKTTENKNTEINSNHECTQYINDDEFSLYEQDFYEKDSKGVNYKALYIHCAFQRSIDNGRSYDNNGNTTGLQSIIKSWWSGKQEQGEYIMFGPGMETKGTSKIFINLLWNNKFIATKGLLPGNRDGIGSGVRVEYKEKEILKLIAMYSCNERVRGRKFGHERLQNCFYLDHTINSRQNNHRQDDSDAYSGPTDSYILHGSIQYYLSCCKGYKLIFVVNATAGLDLDELNCNRIEINSVLKGCKVNDPVFNENGNNDAENDENLEAENNVEHSNVESNSTVNGAAYVENQITQTERPLLVLACVTDEHTARLPSVQIAALLNLPSIINRPWRVQNVTVSTLEGVENGLEWLIKQL